MTMKLKFNVKELLHVCVKERLVKITVRNIVATF